MKMYWSCCGDWCSLHKGLDVVSACRKAGNSDKNYYYWRRVWKPFPSQVSKIKSLRKKKTILKDLAKICSTCYSSTPPNKLRLLSILGSGNTKQHLFLIRLGATPPAPQTLLEKTKLNGEYRGLDRSTFIFADERLMTANRRVKFKEVVTKLPSWNLVLHVVYTKLCPTDRNDAIKLSSRAQTVILKVTLWRMKLASNQLLSLQNKNIYCIKIISNHQKKDKDFK